VIQKYYLKKIMTIGFTEYCSTWVLGAWISLIVIIPGILLRLVLDGHNKVAVFCGAIMCVVAWCVGFVKMPLVRERILAVNPQTIG